MWTKQRSARSDGRVGRGNIRWKLVARLAVGTRGWVGPDVIKPRLTAWVGAVATGPDRWVGTNSASTCKPGENRWSPTGWGMEMGGDGGGEGWGEWGSNASLRKIGTKLPAG